MLSAETTMQVHYLATALLLELISWNTNSWAYSSHARKQVMTLACTESLLHAKCTLRILFTLTLNITLRTLNLSYIYVQLPSLGTHPPLWGGILVTVYNASKNQNMSQIAIKLQLFWKLLQNNNFTSNIKCVNYLKFIGQKQWNQTRPIYFLSM